MAGLKAQVGLKSETVWGTAVTVDKFNELLTETVNNDGGARYVSKGLRAGRLAHHRAARGVVHIGGPVAMELPNVNLATWLRHCFGTIATTGVGPYVHTASPGNLAGQSFTLQGGRPQADDTVIPFTWAGCKVTAWEIAATVGEYVKFTPAIVAKTETTATGLAVAAYPASLAPFTFTGAALSLAGSAVAVKSFSLKGDNGLKVDREGPGSASIREPVQSDWRDYSGNIDAEFESLTNYTRFLNATQVALVLTFTSGADTLVITCNVEMTGSSPAVSGPDLLDHPQPFSAISATSDAAAITAVFTSAVDTVAT